MSLQLIVKFWILLGMVIFNSLGMMMVIGANINPVLNFINPISSNIEVQAAQKGYDYKLPFRAGEVWQTDYDYGVHTDSRGVGFDFYATKNSTLDILAPTGGKLIRGCSAGNATVLGLYTNSGDYLRFVHMDARTVPISADQTKQVNQGDYLGKVIGAGTYETPTCKLSSDGPHLHLGWLTEMCNFTIDGYTFDCSGIVPCPGVGVYNVSCNRKYLGQQFNSTLVTNSSYNNNYGDRISSKTSDAYSLTVQRGQTDNQTAVILWEDKGMRSQKWEYNPQNGEVRGLAGKCLDAGSGNQDQDARIENCHGKDSQKWLYDSSNRLINPIRNLCLDSYSGNTNGSRLYMGACHDKPNQKWSIPVRVATSSLESINQPITILGKNLALDVKGGDYYNQNQVWLYTGNNSLAQKWEYNQVTGQIKGLAGKCLDGGDGVIGQNLRIEQCNGQIQQQWDLTRTSDLRNRKNNLCIDSYSGYSSTSRLYLFNCHGGNNQKWRIGNINPTPELNQEIASKTNPNFVLDVKGANPDSQTRVQLYNRNDSIAQKWKFNIATGEIKGLTTKCLEAGSGIGGEDVRIYECNGTLSQQWELNANNQMVNRAFGQCMDSFSGNRNESRLYVGNCHSGDNQKWTLINP
jgi:murein DD-endopeptidase MepM/ murein hydrolase activator NlpD